MIHHNNVAILDSLVSIEKKTQIVGIFLRKGYVIFDINQDYRLHGDLNKTTELIQRANLAYLVTNGSIDSQALFYVAVAHTCEIPIIASQKVITEGIGRYIQKICAPQDVKEAHFKVIGNR